MRLGLAMVVAAFGLSTWSCHLADDIDAPKCDPGWHPENQRCVEDKIAANLVTLGQGCTITPETLRVPANTDFMFRNTDDEEHVFTVLGGKLVEAVGPGETSRFIRISGAGTYTYDVSGCAEGGTIAVE